MNYTVEVKEILFKSSVFYEKVKEFEKIFYQKV